VIFPGLAITLLNRGVMPVDLRYPIGKYQAKSTLTPQDRAVAVEYIARTPDRVRSAVAGLAPDQMEARYRPEGWTVNQIIHHLSDSHMNGYVRFKLALTEQEPTVKPYDESRWAELPDSWKTPVEVSLALLDALHKRWVVLFRCMHDEDFARSVNHPERGNITLDCMLDRYAWHGRHHVAHITSLRERKGWL
jgi:hypothetical protein